MRLLLAALTVPALSAAYPSFVGFGYTSCQTCHFNPLGNGPLTDYGRALASTEIAGRLFADASEETLGKNSGFFGPYASLPDWLRLSAGYRGNYVVSGVEAPNPTKRFIQMQAEASVVLKSPGDRFIAVVTAGYALVPSAVSPTRRATTSNFISREHYAGYRISRSFGLYAGFLDTAFGLRVPDHNAYVRSRTVLNINDQSHGVLAHFTGRGWDAAAHLLLGNLFQRSDLRQKGLSVLAETDVDEKIRLGGSVLVTTGTFRSRLMAGAHARLGFGTGSSLVAAVGVSREAPQGQATTLGDYLFAQTSLRLARGAFALMTFEQYAENLLGEGSRLFRAGPSIQWFPFARLELRADFLATRVLGLKVVNPDIYTLMGQVHLWL